MAFQTFINKGMQVTSGPMSLSISKDGFAYLNTDTSRALGDTDYIVFLFDGETGRLAFKPTTEGAEGAYKLTRVGPGRSCTMRKVLQHFGFSIKDVQGKHFLIPERGEEGVYVIDLLDQYTTEDVIAAIAALNEPEPVAEVVEATPEPEAEAPKPTRTRRPRTTNQQPTNQQPTEVVTRAVPKPKDRKMTTKRAKVAA